MGNEETRSFTIVSVTLETLDRLYRAGYTDAAALYMAYACIAQWQGNHRPKASDSFMMKRLKWGDEKLRKNKKILKSFGLVEAVKDVGEDGKVKGWYIKINHLVSKNQNPQNQNPCEPELATKGTSTLKETKVLSTKEVHVKQELHDHLDELKVILETPKAINLPARVDALKKRYKHFTREQITLAANKVAASDFHMGRDPKNPTKYASIDYLLHSDKRLDTWLNSESKELTNAKSDEERLRRKWNM